jgi:hypothetical protein
VHALRELGLEAVATRRESGENRPYRSAYTAWAGLVLADRERWTDLLLEAEPLSVSTVFSRALQRPPTASHSQSFMVEALTIISSALGATLMNRGIDVLMPYLAQGQRIDRDDRPLPVSGQAVTYFFELAGAEFALTVMEHLCPAQRELVRTMRTNDVLAENFPPTEKRRCRSVQAGDRAQRALHRENDRLHRDQRQPPAGEGLQAHAAHAAFPAQG